MKNLVIIILVILLLGGLVYTFVNWGGNGSQPGTATSTATTTQQVSSSSPNSASEGSAGGGGSPSPTFTNVKIALIALNDGAKSGTAVGCGDSAVLVNQQVAPTPAPLTAAIEKLLALKTRYYGESGLYNSLYQSNLKLDSASVANGTATIKLSGTTQLGGTCDDPRFAAQIKQTALQFSTVKNVDVYINGKKMEDVLSEK